MVGCAGYGMKSIPPKHNSTYSKQPENLSKDFRDKLVFAANQPKLMVTRVALTKAAFVAPKQFNRTLAFDLVEPVNVIIVIESASPLGPWQPIYEDAPGLWIGAGPKQVTFGSNLDNAFYNVGVRNEP